MERRAEITPQIDDEITERGSTPTIFKRGALAIGASILSLCSLASVESAMAAESQSEVPSHRAVANQNSFRLGTYNVLADFHRGMADARAKIASRLIMGKGDGPGKLDIVGLQELAPSQKRFFDKYLDGYQSIPRKKHTTNGDWNYIYYDPREVEKLDEGVIKYPFYGDRKLRTSGKAVWGKFKDHDTAKEFYVISSHSVAWNNNPGSDRMGAEKREKTAHVIDKFVDAVNASEPEVGVFKVGDDNATKHIRLKPSWNAPRPNKDKALHGNKKRLSYYIYTEADGPDTYNLQESRDVLRGLRGHGPDKKHTWINDNIVDYVYIPGEGWSVSDWDMTKNDFASDHYMISTEVSPLQ